MRLSSSESLQDYAYESLKQEIMSGRIPLGSRLVEMDCAKKYHVSRTPIREAFNRLLVDGLVENVPGSGMTVTIPTIDDIKEINSIITDLSNLMGKHAMQRATKEELDEMDAIADQIDRCVEQGKIDEAVDRCDEIHQAIWFASGMTHMRLTMDSLPQYWKYNFLKQNISVEKHVKSILEHRRLIRFIREKNYEDFCRLMESHMRNSCRWCIEAYEELRQNRKKEE